MRRVIRNYIGWSRGTGAYFAGHYKVSAYCRRGYILWTSLNVWHGDGVPRCFLRRLPRRIDIVVYCLADLPASGAIAPFHKIYPRLQAVFRLANRRFPAKYAPAPQSYCQRTCCITTHRKDIFFKGVCQRHISSKIQQY